MSRLDLTVLTAVIATALISNIAVSAAEEPCKAATAQDDKGRKVIVLENGYVRAIVTPARGGMISSLIHKRTGREYVGPAEGMLMDLDYSFQLADKCDYKSQNYVFEIAENTPTRVSLKLTGQSKTPPLNWIEVAKTITLQRDSAAIRVAYRYANHPDAMQPITIKPWIQNQLNALDLTRMLFAMPLESGRYVVDLDKNKPSFSKLGNDPAQGWVGAWTPGGNGLACFPAFKELHQYYLWTSPSLGTVEWRLSPVDVPNGGAVETAFAMLPFAGLQDLAGGAGGVVCGLPVPQEATQGKPVSFQAELASGAALDGVTVDARVRHLSDGEWKVLGEKPCTLAADAPLKLTFGEWTPDRPGTWVLQSRVSREGRRLFDTERTVVIGEPTPGYTLAAEGLRSGSRNIIPDPSCESRQTPWLLSNASWDDTVCHSGRASIKVTIANDPINRAIVARHKVPVKPGEKYTVSFWKRSPVFGQFRINVSDLDAQGKPLSPEKRRCEVYFKGRSHEWARYEAPFESLPGAAFVDIYFYVFGADALLWLDDLGMVPGETTTQTSPAQTDIPYTMEVVTPHVPWARPYSRGPIKALLLTHQENARDIIELAERLEMDFQTVTLTGSPEQCAYASGTMVGRRIEDEQNNLRGKLSRKYDVIVIGGIPWKWMEKKARAAIVAQTLEGAGLVYIQPSWLLDDLLRPADADVALPVIMPDEKNIHPGASGVPFKVKEHPITSGIAFRAFIGLSTLNQGMSGETLLATDAKTPVLAVGPYGKGRVAILNYRTSRYDPYRADAFERGLSFTESGLFPVDRNAMARCHYHYWEYIWAALARITAWAADKAPEVEVTAIEPDGGGAKLNQVPRESLSITFRSPRPVTGTLEMSLLDEYSLRISGGQEKASLEAGAPKTFTFAVPKDAPAGLIFAEFILRDAEGKSLNWATTVFENPKPVTLVGIRLDRENKVYKRGEKVSVRLALSAEAPGATLKAEVVDTWGRLLVTQTAPVTGKEMSVELAPEHPVSVRLILRATLLQGTRIIDRGEERFTVTPDKSPWDQYQFVISDQRARHDYLKDAMYDLLARHGFTCVRGYDALGNADHNMNFLADVGGFGDVRKATASGWSRYQQTGDLKYLERDPPAYDEKRWQTQQQRYEKAAVNYAQVSPLIYGLGDENNLGGAPVDYDYSPSVLAWFRRWLQERYGTLDKLNAQWETDFAKWDDVMPMPLPAAQKRSENLSPWADHREFMDCLFAEFHAQAKAAIRRGDPDALVGISGTQAPGAYNGYDWSKLMPVFDALLTYGKGGQAAIQRSLKRIPAVSWGGYGATGPGTHMAFWNALMYGKQIALWRDWLVYEPDWRLCQSGKDYVEGVRPLVNGIGKLLIQSEWIPGGVALHYSQASIRAAAAAKRDGPFEQARVYWMSLLMDLGMQPGFVTYEQIEQGQLTPDRVRVLVLPESEAVSEKEAIALRAYVKAGGVLIADTRCALRDGHCRLLPAGRLDDLFGIRRKAAASSRPPRSVALRDGEGVVWPHKELILGLADDAAGTAATDGKALGDCGGTPCFIWRALGRGKAVYLNFEMTVYPRVGDEGVRFRDNLRALLAILGALPPVTVTGDDGLPFFGCQVNHFRNGTEDLIAVLPDSEQFQLMKWSKRTAKVRLPERKWVYEVVSGVKMGQTGEATVEMTPYEPCLLALLPGEVKGVSVDGPGAARPGQVVRFDIRANAQPALKDRQLVRIEVTGPDGQRRRDYSTILWLASAGGAYELPLALSDAPGPWRVSVTHVVSGAKAERSFTLAAAEGK